MKKPREWECQDLGYDGWYISDGHGKSPKECRLTMVEKQAYDSLLAQADKLAEALDDLIESIETPSRLGVSDPPNPDWVALNNAKKEIKDYRGEK